MCYLLPFSFFDTSLMAVMTSLTKNMNTYEHSDATAVHEVTREVNYHQEDNQHDYSDDYYYVPVQRRSFTGWFSVATW
jgi:hypothetical protein